MRKHATITMETTLNGMPITSGFLGSSFWLKLMVLRRATGAKDGISGRPRLRTALANGTSYNWSNSVSFHQICVKGNRTVIINLNIYSV